LRPGTNFEDKGLLLLEENLSSRCPRLRPTSRAEKKIMEMLAPLASSTLHGTVVATTHKTVEDLDGEVAGTLEVAECQKKPGAVGEGKLLPAVGEEHAPILVEVHRELPCSLTLARFLQKGTIRFLLTGGLDKRLREIQVLQGLFIHKDEELGSPDLELYVLRRISWRREENWLRS
jgi:hypothetical protein